MTWTVACCLRDSLHDAAVPPPNLQDAVAGPRTRSSGRRPRAAERSDQAVSTLARPGPFGAPVAGSAAGPGLLGRRDECDELDKLVVDLRAGRSRALVLRGEAEMELAFAGLHQLCAPLLDRLDRLPAPQRDALRVPFRLNAGDPPDRFMVGLATLGLVVEAAEEESLGCVVDDGQWLDRVSAQTLAFVARRLMAALRDARPTVAAARGAAGEPVARCWSARRSVRKISVQPKERP